VRVAQPPDTPTPESLSSRARERATRHIRHRPHSLPMELVEREPALAALMSGFACAADRNGRVALLSGEAGIGKSVLASSFVARHGDAADVL
jgi:DNA-binding NtrC family response regulator